MSGYGGISLAGRWDEEDGATLEDRDGRSMGVEDHVCEG